MRLIIGCVLTVALSSVAAPCGGDSDNGGNGANRDAEDFARTVLTALQDGKREGFQETYVQPAFREGVDYYELFDHQALSGCDIGSADSLANPRDNAGEFKGNRAVFGALRCGRQHTVVRSCHVVSPA
jgi:hypothetical protein